MTGANKVDEAEESGTPGIVRVDRLVRALDPERDAFEAAMAKAGYHTPANLYRDGTYRDTSYSAGWDMWKAATSREREACASLCEDTEQEFDEWTGVARRWNSTCALAIRKRSNVGR